MLQLLLTTFYFLQQSPEQQRLRESADLYAQLYAEDPEMRELTDAALIGWPE
jgi:preprotein translocase subunit YajC